jgi:hypothetical protein
MAPLLSLSAKMIADNGALVLTEGAVNSLPASLVARPFRPALPPLVVLAALLVSRPSLNADRFARQLKEEAERRKKPTEPAAPGQRNSETRRVEDLNRGDLRA